MKEIWSIITSPLGAIHTLIECHIDTAVQFDCMIILLIQLHDHMQYSYQFS